MTQVHDRALVADAIARLQDAAGLTWPPPVSRVLVPVPLDRLIATYNLVHSEVPGLTRAIAGAHLSRWGVDRPELHDDKAPLAGFLFANARGGYILVEGDDPLPRRRFTAAHELGHYLLHFLPRLRVAPNEETYLVQVDGDETVCEEKLADDKALSLPEMERQANLFAAELLMPETVCRGTKERYSAEFGATQRFLEHHLARELLVSRGAVQLRLAELGLA
jgi:hypothetical protein